MLEEKTLEEKTKHALTEKYTTEDELDALAEKYSKDFDSVTDTPDEQTTLKLFKTSVHEWKKSQKE